MLLSKFQEKKAPVTVHGRNSPTDVLWFTGVHGATGRIHLILLIKSCAEAWKRWWVTLMILLAPDMETWISVD